MKTLTCQYTLRFGNGVEKVFLITLRDDDLSLVSSPRADLPAWTELSFLPCTGCPLDPAVHERCPVAVSLVDVVEFLKDLPSYEEVDVSVEFRGRTYSKRTSLQVAAGALIGLLMPTCGCPVMDRLRPMVDTHLPFMKPEEACYRILSMYLTSQYFLSKSGRKPDWDLENLPVFMDQVTEVNRGICKRLNSIPMRDASVNAVALLNALGEGAGFSIRENDLERLEKIFLKPYQNG